MSAFEKAQTGNKLLEELVVNPASRQSYKRTYGVLREQILDIIAHWAVSNKIVGSPEDKEMAKNIIVEFNSKLRKT